MNSPAPCLADIDVVILAGGLGTRIRDTLGDTPKLLAPVAGTPFLDLLIRRLQSFGARRLVLGLGHLADRVQAHLAANPPDGIEAITAVEPKPLGTAGALRFVRPHIKTDPVLVMNGDSFFAADLGAFVESHRAGGTDASILCAPVENTQRFGRLDISDDGRVRAFLEKDDSQSQGQPAPGVINAGVYLFDRTMLDRIDEMPGPSLERDVFEQLAPGTLNAVTGDGAFIDIGTPDDLARAADVLKPYF
ncbi:MAG: nucleotidyltransferase family protein [Rhodospirillales bacterium]|nr:nucleotidyltransferase family protein [Alphaproteobacteria bacterium]MBL6948613.1 nucleotidyltransferase family protein [Rhodospirillales bacterium]